MKKTMRKFYPVLFSLALFLLYFIIYPSPETPENYSTALLVFSTALGSSAMVIFHRRRDIFLFYLYPMVSCVFPFVVMSFLPLFNTLEQKVTIGLQAAALIMLLIFIVYLSKNERN